MNIRMVQLMDDQAATLINIMVMFNILSSIINNSNINNNL